MNSVEIFSLLVKHVVVWLFLGSVPAYFGLLSLESVKKFLKVVVVNILLPILMFEKIVSNLKFSDIERILILFVAALCVICVSYIFARIVHYKFKLSEKCKNTFLLSNSFHNYGYIVFPMVEFMLGEKSLALTFIFALTCDVLIWSFGVSIVRSNKEKFKFVQVFTAPVIAVCLALLIVSFGLSGLIAPSVLIFLSYIGKSVIPLALISLGAIFYYSVREANFLDLPLRELAFSTIMRSFLFPVLWMTILFFLPIEREISKIIAIEIIMPASMGVGVIAAIYGGDYSFAVINSLISNLLGVLTIPLYWSIADSFLF